MQQPGMTDRKDRTNAHLPQNRRPIHPTAGTGNGLDSAAADQGNGPVLLMDAINIEWTIEITCDGKVMGPAITTTAWDVFTKVAAFRQQMPYNWHVDAYPIGL